MPVDPTSLDDPTEVQVLPRYLAGPGEPGLATRVAWPISADDGWALHCPADGYVLCASPCQRIKIGFRSDSAGGGRWRTAVFDDPFEPAQWRADFDYGVPEELLADFYQTLLAAYADGEHGAVDRQAPTAGYLPLLNAGWSHSLGDPGWQHFIAPGSAAQLRHSSGRSRDDYISWRLAAGLDAGTGRWEASFTHRTPVRLIAAFTASMVADDPITRTAAQLPPANLPHLQTHPTPGTADQLTGPPAAARAPAERQTAAHAARPRR